MVVGCLVLVLVGCTAGDDSPGPGPVVPGSVPPPSSGGPPPGGSGGGLVFPGAGQGGAAGGGGGGLVLPHADAAATSAPHPDAAATSAPRPDAGAGPGPVVDAAPIPVSPDAMPAQPPTPCNPSASPSTCAAGQWCSKATRTCLETDTVMRWTFSNMCASAGDIGVRLLDLTNGGGWPAAGKIYVIEANTKRFVEISCIDGAKVCFGARSSDGQLIWGADTDFSSDCTDCCETCTAGASPAHDLVCDP
jgi:hypothetical protein